MEAEIKWEIELRKTSAYRPCIRLYLFPTAVQLQSTTNGTKLYHRLYFLWIIHGQYDFETLVQDITLQFMPFFVYGKRESLGASITLQYIECCRCEKQKKKKKHDSLLSLTIILSHML